MNHKSWKKEKFCLCGKCTIVADCIILKSLILRHEMRAGYIGLVSAQVVAHAMEVGKILRKHIETKNKREEP